VFAAAISGFGFHSGAALATIFDVLIEARVMPSVFLIVNDPSVDTRTTRRICDSQASSPLAKDWLLCRCLLMRLCRRLYAALSLGIASYAPSLPLDLSLSS
jgi:hypothetical protein